MRQAVITVFPPLGGHRADDAEPLIKEARDRQRRRRRWTGLLVLIVAIGAWLASSNLGRHSALGDASTGATPLNSSATTTLPNPCLLLTKSQIAPLLSGGVQTRTRSGDSIAPTCTWTGPPEGYMQDHDTLTIQIFHVTKARFKRMGRLSKPPMISVTGLGGLAYKYNGGVQEWRNGVALEMDGRYPSVYPRQALRLAQLALTRSPQR